MRPIDADALIADIRATFEGAEGAMASSGALYAIVALKSAPTLDDLRPKGYWIGVEADGYADGVPVYNLWQCSECGEEVEGEDVPDTHPFCYGCGADMRGGGEDG